MHISAVGVLFLLVGSSLGQSGDSTDTPDDDDLEHEMRTSVKFECFSKMRLTETAITCIVTERPYETTDITYFNICIRNKCTKQEENKALKIEGGILELKACIRGSILNCRNYTLYHIVVPDPPSLFFHYNNQSGEYIFNVKEPYGENEYLKDKLIHEVVIRKKGADWPLCGNERSHGGYKMCWRDDYIQIPRRNLEYSTSYESRARSKPNGEFFNGPWSQWSEIVHFVTTEPKEKNDNEGEEEVEDLLVVILCCCAVVVVFILVIVLTKLFWKDRIKPFIWPELPDHKNALEKFCISPTKYIQISFNPDFFDNYHINKVDYMKAQVRTEDNLQVSTDTQLEKQLDSNGGNNISSPAVGNKESFSLMSHSGQCSEPSDHMAANDKSEINSLETPAILDNVLLPSTDSSSTCIIPNDNPETHGAGTENFHAYSYSMKQPNNELRGLCWEDISMYIAMSAFKTPNSTIKQSQ